MHAIPALLAETGFAAAARGGDAIFYFGTAVFLLTYLVIAFERRLGIDKTVAALVGSSLMLLFVLRIRPEEDLGIGAYSHYVRFDVIFLLIGMMIVVHALGETGVFQYVAIRCAKLGRGEPARVLALLVTVTAVSSAFLDNVTTVLLIAPMTLLVAEQLRVDPVAFLIPVALASNIGGTATMIGDPPNILIGNYVDGLGFVDFLIYLAPFVGLFLALFAGALVLATRRRTRITAEERARIMDLDESRAITDRRLLVKSLAVMAFTLLGFLFHGFFHIEPGVIAMTGAALMLLIGGLKNEDVFAAIEWPMIFFLVGLFVVVAGAVHVGLIGRIAGALTPLIGKNPYLAAVLILWVSGIAAGGFNAFGFTTAALPLVREVAEHLGLSGPAAFPLWWALALGACLGGNLTPVGTTANLVTCDLARRSGKRISFGMFMKWGAPCALGALALSTGYVLLLGYLAWG